MRPEERDLAYLWDMLDAAQAVLEFTNDVTFEQYVREPMRQRAVERSIEILGEAARRVSDEFKAQRPEIPWRAIIRQRNVLAHEYDDIRHEFIWAVARERIPELISQIAPFVPSEKPDDSSK
jgi:uncharacterized protein with HEPN domain